MTKYIHAAALAREIGCTPADVRLAIRLGVCRGLQINGGYLVPEHDAGRIRSWLRTQVHDAKTPETTGATQ